MDWEKILANNVTQQGLISKIYRQLMQVNNKTNKQPNQKLSRKSGQTFLHRRHTDGQQEGRSTLLIIREMQIKTTVRCHLTPVRMDIQRSLQVPSAGVVEKREPSHTVGRNVNWCSHHGKLYGGFLKN